ncbi:hypothetical protein LPB140_08610 [Sphingorhabdus lutea]|uniref:Transglycosylase SLT domain-containing protein n=2 Tax=Sphingorhabdus lutea TaxID=1913578 RepID=A0A1L3JF32_9SPHN|nr:hypothetical protein LPB140_08610 [Sphingorhabdus lutea]
MMDISEGNIPAALNRWRELNRSDNYSFNEYATFLMTYEKWPNESKMRSTAEQALDLNNYSPSQAIAFFNKLPPQTNVGKAKYAIILQSGTNNDAAIKYAKQAWRGGTLPDDIEAALLGKFASHLNETDHDARIDKLIWVGATSAATKMLPYASAKNQPIFAARIAIRTNSSDASTRMEQVGAIAITDAGYLGERARYLRNNGSGWAARELLANRQTLSSTPADIENWYEILLTLAREAANDGQYQTAYNIASKVDDAIPMGEEVINQSLGVRDDYTSLTWLAGTIALENLNRPADAVKMFANYGNAAKSPQTRTKGFYWAAKAAKTAGDNATANQFFEQAAAYHDQFYGQLSLEALGRSGPKNGLTPALPHLTQNENSPSVYLAAQISARNGGWKEQTLFLRAIANGADNEQDFLDAFSLSKQLNRPDLAVMAGRNARVEDFSNFINLAFPTISVPYEHQDNFTLIHAITRQESQFDREAISHAGARGLMQLMPATARETSGRIGLSYNLGGLTGDTHYNIQLGSTYIKSMLRYYGGSYPLAVAAYNAGPGNVNKWLRANGDPRTGQIDILTWIERIPIYETKNYVQRVLENAVMYDALNPDKAEIKGPNPLSRYLGKNTPR